MFWSLMSQWDILHCPTAQTLTHNLLRSHIRHTSALLFLALFESQHVFIFATFRNTATLFSANILGQRMKRPLLQGRYELIMWALIALCPSVSRSALTAVTESVRGETLMGLSTVGLRCNHFQLPNTMKLSSLIFFFISINMTVWTFYLFTVQWEMWLYMLKK